jgi:hypothetical protein
MAINKAFRVAHLGVPHITMLNLLSSTPQTLHTLASPLGISDDLAERQLSLLIDEGLALRLPGAGGHSRTTSTYVAA